MAGDTVILPVRLDSYAGAMSAIEAHFFKSSEEYGAKSVPDKSMWIAVPIINGKVSHDNIDYGYKSLKELLEEYKNHDYRIVGLRTNRKDAELERAREIAEDALGVLLAGEDNVVAFIQGEIGLEDGALKKAYQTLRKAKTQSTKVPEIDRDEVFYSLCIDDIFLQADEAGVPKEKLTRDAIKQIIRRIEGSLEDTNNKIQDAITDELNLGGEE